MNALFALNHFLTIYEGMEGDYQIYIEKFGREEIKLQLFCVDPSGKLAQCLEKGEASVLFSATFLPIRYYKRLLGGTDEDYEVYAKSSFDPEKLGLFIAGDVTSRYRSRGTDQYANYLTHYITDTWYHVGEDSKIHEILTVIRHPESGEIISAQLQKQESSLDLVHALFTRTDQAVDLSFSCFADFRDVAQSSALFLSGEGCEEDGTALCLNFVQSLSGQANDANSQYTTFRLDPEDSFIRKETIRYARMALILTKTTLNLEKADTLPDDLLVLMDTIK